jgi:hypothetical protein
MGTATRLSVDGQRPTVEWTNTLSGVHVTSERREVGLVEPPKKIRAWKVFNRRHGPHELHTRNNIVRASISVRHVRQVRQPFEPHGPYFFSNVYQGPH